MFGKMVHHLILLFYKYSLPVSITSSFYMFITDLLLITYFNFQLIILTCFNLTHNSFLSDLLTSDHCGLWSWDLAIPNIRILILIVGLCIIVSAVLDWIKKKLTGAFCTFKKKKKMELEPEPGHEVATQPASTRGTPHHPSPLSW